MNDSATQPPSGATATAWLAAAGVAAALGLLLLWWLFAAGERPADTSDRGEHRQALRNYFEPPRRLAAGRFLTVWWDRLPDELRQHTQATGPGSNIHPADYTGPESCQRCHERNYAAWAEHPHRWMNARAAQDTVLGDFNGGQIRYRGGEATFYRAGGQYCMRLQRDAIVREYAITQTIGRRFFQYYVGKQIEGPEPPGHHFTTEEHVLPFGYWLDEKEWVPVVHIGPEAPDQQRPDPFAPPERGPHYAEYASSCNYCHTTFPLGDLLGRRTRQMGEHAPQVMHWSIRPYLEQSHPGKAAELARLAKQDSVVENPLLRWDAAQHAVTFGISCEACHLGGREHVESGGKIAPRFFPASPHLTVEAKEPVDFRRTHANINWACGRCHIGGRPRYAAGMSTWNSVEYSDAMLGSCYSKMTCIDCHNPHRGIGKQWAQTAEQDDASCLRCHEQLRGAAALQAHTHHPLGSEGSRCMNCHMPRINEGLQDMVRTHMIYSPTRADMLEANHPNACNMCHTDRPIDWTLEHLEQWYGKRYDQQKIAENYPRRAAPVALGWLQNHDPAVRLVAVDALARSNNRAALDHIVGALDDPYLVNRQFAARSLEGMLGFKLRELGYRFYQTQTERREPLAKLRARLASEPTR